MCCTFKYFFKFVIVSKKLQSFFFFLKDAYQSSKCEEEASPDEHSSLLTFLPHLKQGNRPPPPPPHCCKPTNLQGSHTASVLPQQTQLLQGFSGYTERPLISHLLLVSAQDSTGTHSGHFSRLFSADNIGLPFPVCPLCTALDTSGYSSGPPHL